MTQLTWKRYVQRLTLALLNALALGGAMQAGGWIRVTTVLAAQVVPSPPGDYFPICPANVRPPATDFTIQQRWSTPNVDGQRVLAYQTPVVGDLYGNGQPVAVVASDDNFGLGASVPGRHAKNLRVVNGADGTILRTITTPEFSWSGHAVVAIADVDGDGQGEIILKVARLGLNPTALRGRLMAYRNDGTVLWTSDQTYDYDEADTRGGAAISLADFNGDGAPEVYVGTQVFNARTGARLASATSAASAGCPYPTQFGCFFGQATAVDMDGDGPLELVAGNVVYKVNLANTTGEAGNSLTLWRQADASVADVGDGWTAVADVDRDGAPDVVVVRTADGRQTGQTRVYVWNAQTGAVMAMAAGIGSRGSAPLIGDIDGDGAPEIVLQNTNALRAFKFQTGTGLVSKWTLSTVDSSGGTSLAMFDFNNDGVQELVYRDESNLRIIDGSSSTAVNRTTFACTSDTGTEMPVIAALDDTRQASILVTCGEAIATGYRGTLRAFETASFPWASTRPVWNQQAYFVTHVNNDLTIPAPQFPYWTQFDDPGQQCSSGVNRPLNAFQQQVTDLDRGTGCPVICWAASVTIEKTTSAQIAVPGQPVTYTITVKNDGPGDSPDTLVQDPFPAGIASAQWSCAGSGGAVCPNATSGGPVSPPNMLNETVTLPAHSTLTYTIVATVDTAPPEHITNTASVNGAAVLCMPDSTLPPCEDSVTLGRPVADLAIMKVSSPNPYTPGQPLTYTIIATNLGPSDAPGSLVADTFPFAGFMWTCSGTGGGTCPAGGSGNLNSTVNLPAGGSVTFIATGTVPIGTTGQLQNTATVTAPAGVTDPVTGNNQHTNSNPSTPTADLSISKVSSPNPYVPGQPLTYTLVVSNAGPTAANGALVEDTWPFSGFTWTCAASGGGACGAAGGSGNLNQLVNLPVGGSVTFTATATVPVAQTGQVTNTATVTPPASVTDVIPGNNQDTDDNPVLDRADLSITKTQSPDPYVPGQPIAYTIVATNNGPNDAANARVQDTPDPSLTNVQWTCAPSGAGASCAAASGTTAIDTLVTLPAGASVTFTMTANVPATRTGVLSNTATVQPPAGLTDQAPSNNLQTVNSGPAPEADLSITKTVTPEPYRPGTAVTYTITVSNAGPSNVTGGRVHDVFPAPMSGFTWTCGGSGGATCGIASGASVIDTLVNVPVGGTITFTASGVVPASTTATVTNTATVTPPAGTNDSRPGNNSHSATSTPIYADVSITKTDVADPVAATDAIVYTLAVSNAGASTATNVVVSDPLPPGTTYISASGAGWSCTFAGGTVTCTRPSLAVGQTAPITVTLRAPGEAGTVTNTASVTAAELDPEPGNNSSPQTTTITPKADLTITKVSTPNPYVGGDPFTYTIVVSNLGPSGVTGASVIDTLPPDLATFTWTCTPNSAGAACGTSSGSAPTVSTLVDLPSGGSVTILVSGTLPPGTTDPLLNIAEVIAPAGVQDPAGNNRATDLNPADNQADLRISKASTPNPYVPGEALTYTLVVTNAGPSNAVGGRVQDPLPAAFAGFGWTCTTSGGAVCPNTTGTGDIDEVIDLPVGSSATFTSTGTVPSSYTGLAANTATVTPPADVQDPVPGNNVDQAQNPPGPKADLSITKTQTPEPYVPGAAITYTLLVQNLGPSDVANARVQDVLPGVITGATWTCAASGAGASCGSAAGVNVVDALVTLPAGTSATFAISGTVLPGATGILSNTATVTEPVDVTDPVAGNNTATVNSGGAPQTDLSVVKTASINPYVPGTPLAFTIVVTNNGPSDAANARVQDLFPPALSGFTWTCTPTAGAAVCGAASGMSLIDVLVQLPAGSAVTFGVSGTVPPETTGPLVNTASVTPAAGIDDPRPENNASAATLGAAPMANLRVAKTSTPNPYVPGGVITYTIVYTNDGPSDAFGARVREQAPLALTNITWTCVGAGGTCPPAGSGPFDELVDISAGGSVTFTLTADVPSDMRGALVNSATIVPPPDIIDPTPTDNASVDANPVVPPGGPADLQITQVAPSVAPPNGLLTFRLVVRNLGSHPALNPYTTGMIPPGTTFVSATPSAGGIVSPPGNPPAPDPATGYPIAGAAAVAPLKVTWPGLMHPGDTHTLEFTVRVAPGTPTGQILWSCWWTWSETEDPYHANNVVDAYLFVHDGVTPVGELALQGATMTEGVIAAERPARVGEAVPIRFWATNNGPAATRGQYALILDTLNAIDIVDIKVAQGWVGPTSPQTAMWDTGLVQPGQSVALDLTVRLRTPGAVELFAQRITGSPGDPNATNERATIVLDGYAPGAAGRWVAVGNVDGAGAGEILTGAGQGETPQVRVFTGTGADTGARFFAYERPFLGGVQIASCDVDGDGTAEVITAPGPGRAPTIRVLRIVDGVVTELIAFDAFEAGFLGGASIACADLDADGSAELVVGAGPGRAPEVQVYSAGLSTLTQRATFLAYEDAFRGGVRVAAGAYPGRPGWLGAFAIATTPGPGRPVDLRLWEETGAPVAQVGISSAKNGILPTLGDANGDGQLDLVVAPDDGRPELVRIFDVDTGNVIGDVPGGLPAFPVGVRIALGVLTGGPGVSEIIVGNGPGGHPRVRVVFWPPAGPVQRLEILPLEIP